MKETGRRLKMDIDAEYDERLRYCEGLTNAQLEYVYRDETRRGDKVFARAAKHELERRNSQEPLRE